MGDPKRAVGGHLNTIWIRLSLDLSDFTRLGAQTSNHTCALSRKVESTIRMEGSGMRVARLCFVFGDLSGFGIKLADCGVAVACVPDVSVLVSDDAVGFRCR